MLFRLKFEGGEEYCQAKDILHLLQSYEREYNGFQEILELEEVSEIEAKKIIVYDDIEPKQIVGDVVETSLFDLYHCNNFELIASFRHEQVCNSQE